MAVLCSTCAPVHRMIPDRLMVGQLTLDQPVVVRIHVREPIILIPASCAMGGFLREVVRLR